MVALSGVKKTEGVVRPFNHYAFSDCPYSQCVLTSSDHSLQRWNVAHKHPSHTLEWSNYCYIVKSDSTCGLTVVHSLTSVFAMIYTVLLIITEIQMFLKISLSIAQNNSNARILYMKACNAQCPEQSIRNRCTSLNNIINIIIGQLRPNDDKSAAGTQGFDMLSCRVTQCWTACIVGRALCFADLACQG